MLLATTLAYAPGLDGPLLLDDRPVLGALAAIGDGALAPLDFLAGAGDGTVFRPVARASFLLDWWLWGDDVRAFKAVNLALHLLGGVVLFALTHALVALRAEARPGEPGTAHAGERDACVAALLAASLWLLSPLLVSTVLYTVQRMAVLSALFSLAGLLCYVHGRRRGSRTLIACTFAVCWPLAALGKENGALLPLLALLVECWWLPADAAGRRARAALAALCALAAVAALARAALDPQWILAGYAGRDFSLPERLLTQPRVLLDSLGQLLLAPGTSPLGLLRDDVTASRGLLDPPATLLALLAWAGLVAAAFATRRSPAAPAGFGLAFFLVAHALEASVFPLELYFEHRNYLPAAGLYLGLAACAPALRTRGRGRWTVPGAVALVLVFALLTAQRVQIWRSEASLYAHAADAHPRSARAWQGLASVHFAAGRFDAGARALERARALLPAHARLGVSLQHLAAWCIAGRPAPEAVYARLESAPALGHDLQTVNALAWLAGALANGACTTLDRPRLATILAHAEPSPAPWDPARVRLRAAHRERLLHALSP